MCLFVYIKGREQQSQTENSLQYGLQYTKVRGCIENSCFLCVFETVELVVQGHSLACAFVGLKNVQ
jgi:hypothetical protein